MIFRKDALLFYQNQIICITMSICLIFMLTFGLEWFLLIEIPFVILILLFPKIYNEYIIIDEYGISCHKSGMPLWEFNWMEIAELKKSSRYRSPSVEIIKYDKFGTPEQFSYEYYFQMSKMARKALKQYCPFYRTRQKT